MSQRFSSSLTWTIYAVPVSTVQNQLVDSTALLNLQARIQHELDETNCMRQSLAITSRVTLDCLYGPSYIYTINFHTLCRTMQSSVRTILASVPCLPRTQFPAAKSRLTRCQYLDNMSDDHYGDHERSNADHSPQHSTQYTTSRLNPVMMDLLRGVGVGGTLMNNSPQGILLALANTWGPRIYKLVKKYPRLAAMANIPVVLWLLSKYVTCNWDKIRKWLMS